MLSLADTTSLLDETTSQVMSETGTLTPQSGIALIDEWLQPLQEAENTKPMAEHLSQLKTLLQATSPDGEAVRAKLGVLAEQLSILGTDMGGEGEMPSLMDALAAALRQAGGSSKADSVDN